jgi:hypothetical protein
MWNSAQREVALKILQCKLARAGDEKSAHELWQPCELTRMIANQKIQHGDAEETKQRDSCGSSLARSLVAQAERAMKVMPWYFLR